MNKASYEVTERTIVFEKGPIRVADCTLKMNDGALISRQILEHPGSVVIVPRANETEFYLIRQLRYAVEDFLWEIPAGGIEVGEDQVEAANRELAEEIGYRAENLKRIISIFPSPGISAEKMHIYLAENLVHDPLIGDEDEVIEVKAFKAVEILQMIKEGKIQDAKTIVAFFYMKIEGLI